MSGSLLFSSGLRYKFTSPRKLFVALSIVCIIPFPYMVSVFIVCAVVCWGFSMLAIPIVPIIIGVRMFFRA